MQQIQATASARAAIRAALPQAQRTLKDDMREFLHSEPRGTFAEWSARGARAVDAATGDAASSTLSWQMLWQQVQDENGSWICALRRERDLRAEADAALRRVREELSGLRDEQAQCAALRQREHDAAESAAGELVQAQARQAQELARVQEEAQQADAQITQLRQQLETSERCTEGLVVQARRAEEKADHFEIRANALHKFVTEEGGDAAAADRSAESGSWGFWPRKSK